MRVACNCQGASACRSLLFVFFFFFCQLFDTLSHLAPPLISLFVSLGSAERRQGSIRT